MATTKTRVSVEEYLALDENPIDCSGYEYIDGEVVPKVAADFRHMGVQRYLDHRFSEHIERFGGYGGPEGRSRFDDEAFYAGREYRLPDISYWAPGRRVRAGEAMTPPTLAVEVRSPGQSRRQQEERCLYFLAHGVSVAWLVDCDDETVIVFDSTGGRTVHHRPEVVSGDELHGFVRDTDRMFAVYDGIE